MSRYLEALLLSMISIFLPLKAALATVIVLIIVDLITGVWASIKKHKKITSAGLRRTITKIFIYELGLAIAFLIEMYLLDGTLPVSKLVGGMIGVTEFKSIAENLDIINGAPLFKTIASKIGSINDSSTAKDG